MIQTLKNQKQTLLNQYQAQKMQQDQNIGDLEDTTAMGEAFDAARNDDTFYLPPEAFRDRRLPARYEADACRRTEKRCGSRCSIRVIR